MVDIDDIKRIADTEFADIVINTTIIDYKLRIALKNHSFIDVYLSRSLPDKFGYHWECMDESGTIYRYDNVPDKNWQVISTYPYHFHNGT